VERLDHGCLVLTGVAEEDVALGLGDRVRIGRTIFSRRQDVAPARRGHEHVERTTGVPVFDQPASREVTDGHAKSLAIRRSNDRSVRLLVKA
jgi:hypothetical protein